MALAIGTGTSLAGAKWTSARADAFEVATDAGPGAAARMARRAAQFRQLLGPAPRLLPLRIILLNDDAAFRALRPSAITAAFFQSGPDEDWIVVRWGRDDSERALSHELVHASLEHSGPRRPLWLEEGLAEFYSTASLDSRGWTIGSPIDSHVRSLNRNAWLGEREFFEAAHDSPLRDENLRAGRFYAQSWAVVHYLLTFPGIRERAPAFFAALADGLPYARACESALGLRPGLLLEAARRAVESGQFRTARVAAAAPAAPVAEPAPLPPADAEDLLVRLALATGRPELAAQTAQSPAQRGLLALAEGRRADAIAALEQAVAAGSPSPAPYFELAMLLRESGGAPDRVQKLLLQTLERNPNHAEAHFLLGLRASARGDLESAIDYFQQSVRILPRQATFWHTLALTLEKAGRTPEARHAAVRCRMAARNAAERQMAAALAHLEPATAPPVRKPDVEVPASWQGPQGDTKAEGRLVEFDCSAQPPVARIQTASETLELKILRPNQIRGPRATLACGPQNTPVRVEYIRQSRELTAFQ